MPPNNEKAVEMDTWLESARRQVADLLLNGGLYQRVMLTLPGSFVTTDAQTLALPPRIHMACTKCVDEHRTTWALQKNPRSGFLDMHGYKCLSCDDTWVTYVLVIVLAKEGGEGNGKVNTTDFSITKVGQYPEWKVPVSPLMEKALGKKGKDLFVKGVSSFRANRGIGAVAYFRRIIEEHIDEILAMVSESATAAGDAVAVQHIKEASSNLYASQRLEIAAKNTPSHLKPGGHNPLDAMYGVFSEGLHEMSDAEAAAVAKQALEGITYFFEMWQQNKERTEQYAQMVTKVATKSS